ncbi:hypothetical protein EDF68_11429 [Ochrobactrum sp. BH3]|nr:hypothetical protein EDF68_11429 [Ochrobactrum sp. BH3]
MERVVNRVMLAQIMGYRLLVRSARMACETVVHTQFYWHLLHELDMKIEDLSHIFWLERNQGNSADFRDRYQAALNQFFSNRIRIEIEEPADTGDYDLALTERPLTSAELGPFVSIIEHIQSENLFKVKAVRLA